MPAHHCRVAIASVNNHRIIAIMLGRLEMDVQDCIDTYSTLIKTIFEKKKSSFSVDWRGNVKGKFSSQLLKSAIDRVIEDLGCSGSDAFNDGKQRNCRV